MRGPSVPDGLYADSPWMAFFSGLLLLWRKPFYFCRMIWHWKLLKRTKPKPWWKKKNQPNVLCMCIICMAGTSFIVFGTITRLLLNMLNVKRKQTLGKCGKPITENVSAGDWEAQGGTEEHVPPPFSNCWTHTDDALSWEKIQLLCRCLYFYIYRQKTVKWHFSV